MPDTLLVKRRWTDSSLVIKPVLDGDHTGVQYSTNGRTYTLKALTSDELDFFRFLDFYIFFRFRFFLDFLRQETLLIKKAR